MAKLEVERAERLVEQERLGEVDQGSGQGDALLLAAGELRGLAGWRSRVSRTTSSSSLTRRLTSPLSTFWLRGPNATLSNTVMWGNSAYCWNTVFTLRL